jgi:hypothetical protein
LRPPAYYEEVNRQSTMENRQCSGAPAGIRTPNQQIMSLLL